MGFNSTFKGLKLLKKPRERAFKQFKWPWPSSMCKMCAHRLAGCWWIALWRIFRILLQKAVRFPR